MSDVELRRQNGFLSTPSARRATKIDLGLQVDACKISIHALREEGDWAQQSTGCTEQYFYPRPPRGGRRVNPYSGLAGFLFLSTPSARRATIFGIKAELAVVISIHALREEGDPSSKSARPSGRNFYPRPPRGGRRPPEAPAAADRLISIHALREEGDLGATIDRLHRAVFLSTPSARRATRNPAPQPRAARFLSTPSARRATKPLDYGILGVTFLSTPSARRATGVTLHQHLVVLFLSTPSARRATACRQSFPG